MNVFLWEREDGGGVLEGGASVLYIRIEYVLYNIEKWELSKEMYSFPVTCVSSELYYKICHHFGR